jgi:hypothetical protein
MVTGQVTELKLNKQKYQGCQLKLKKNPLKLQILAKNPLQIFAYKSPKIPQKYIKFPQNTANSPQYSICVFLVTNNLKNRAEHVLGR